MPERILIQEKILGANDRQAAENRARLDRFGVVALNLMASPGAGKTSLIEHTVRGLRDRWRIAVVDGDIATSLDAERAENAGATAVQINTGGECHLDAMMLNVALDRLNLDETDLLLVENVGNLICPTAFALGDHFRVMIASVPEGADKPYKYPTSYRGIQVLVLNKTDLLPHVPFDLPYFRRGVQALNPGLDFFPLSCQTGEGLENWLGWVRDRLEEAARASDA